MTPSEALARDLSRARERTLRLVEFDDAELRRQYDPLMSPLVWDLAHIGQQEELWLLRGGDPDRPGMLPREVENLYDAFVHSRASRVELPLLSPDQARAYCRTVRSAALDALDANVPHRELVLQPVDPPLIPGDHGHPASGLGEELARIVRTINPRRFNIDGLESGVDGLVSLYAAKTEVGTEFDRLVREKGLKAALDWRAQQFRELEI